MARLSTHVLDTSRGGPAEGLAVDLYFCESADSRAYVKTTTTNRDGRTDEPLIASDLLRPGVYELRFHVAAYFRRTGASTSDPPFLDEITVRFGVSDPGGDYHVPLLVSPYGYTTYRGS